jgi:hypothetical protein
LSAFSLALTSVSLSKSVSKHSMPRGSEVILPQSPNLFQMTRPFARPFCRIDLDQFRAPVQHGAHPDASDYTWQNFPRSRGRERIAGAVRGNGRRAHQMGHNKPATQPPRIQHRRRHSNHPDGGRDSDGENRGKSLAHCDPTCRLGHFGKINRSWPRMSEHDTFSQLCRNSLSRSVIDYCPDP